MYTNVIDLLKKITVQKRQLKGVLRQDFLSLTNEECFDPGS